MGGAISFCVTKTEDATAFLRSPLGFRFCFAGPGPQCSTDVCELFFCREQSHPFPRFTISKFNRASKRSASTGAPALTRGVIASLIIAIRCAHHPQSMLGNVRRDRRNTDRPAPMASGETIKALRQSPVVHDFLDRNRHQFTTLCERVLQVNGSAFRHRSHSLRFGKGSIAGKTNDRLPPQRESFGRSRVAANLSGGRNPRNPSSRSKHVRDQPGQNPAKTYA